MKMEAYNNGEIVTVDSKQYKVTDASPGHLPLGIRDGVELVMMGQDGETNNTGFLGESSSGKLKMVAKRGWFPSENVDENCIC